jgi:hypothetical protein
VKNNPLTPIRSEISRVRSLLDRSDKKQADLADQLKNMSLVLGKSETKHDNMTAQLRGLGPVLPTVERNSALLDAINKAVTLSEDSLKAINHAAILQGLQSHTDQRFEDIREPSANTFTWILGEGQTNVNSGSVKNKEVSKSLVNWLQSGSGNLHILGKPGSGKSTLMKFLATSPRTLDLLQDWAKHDQKELIVSKFFFWKYGSDRQKTMRGLKRRLLYDMIEGSPNVAELVFGSHWCPERYNHGALRPPDLAFSDGQVTAAFDKMLSCDTLFLQYKLCLIIDGLDEFDEPQESLWRLCNQLNSWTGQHATNGILSRCGNIKLLTSSREEPPITNTLRSAERILLHQHTQSDIRRLVEATLDSNQHYQALTQSHKNSKESRSLLALIVMNAEGVFLWVVLLLKSMEEDLATGTSFQALRNIVQTAPRELDEFFAKILGNIPKHHYRGAWFIFAMIMRRWGRFISHSFDMGSYGLNAVDIADALLHPSLFGLSYVFDAFERTDHNREPKHPEFSLAPCHTTEDYCHRETISSAKLQSWCKGLLEPKKAYYVSPGQAKDTEQDEDDTVSRTVAFFHRSIPDFLSSKLQDTMKKLGIDDDLVTCGALATCLAEVRCGPARKAHHEHLLHARLQNFLTMLGIISLVTPELSVQASKLLDDIDLARQVLVNPPAPLLHVAASSFVPLAEYVKWKMKDSVKNRTSMDLLVLEGLNIGTMDRLESYIFLYSGREGCRERIASNTAPLETILGCGISPNTKYSAEESSHIHLSPWREILTKIIAEITFEEKGLVHIAIWDELLVWFRHGAEVPAEILLRCFPAPDGGTPFIGYAFSNEQALVTPDVRRVKRSTPNRQGLRYLRTLSSTTLSSIIRWHAPRNAHALLRFTDTQDVLADGGREWNPPRGFLTPVDEVSIVEVASESDVRRNFAIEMSPWKVHFRLPYL